MHMPPYVSKVVRIDAFVPMNAVKNQLPLSLSLARSLALPVPLTKRTENSDENQSCQNVNTEKHGS